ncbi:hypothetical protein BOO35_18295 [Vibrio navarrensis]|uniref:hypothetical protein n=1 Tax=Vibrio navarrensis TaxID=29495 RepID=UPI001867EB3D|nr:hypothetical protein [Vibrio navarrensis]MBE3667020.1 hypothetical protein [Vibrio navarrensis]
MSLKAQLPNGSPRNKIEYLADFIEQQIAEMSSSERPTNLLKNSIFSERYRISKMYDPSGLKRSELKKMNFIAGCSVPIAPSWVVEVQDKAQVRLCNADFGSFAPYKDYPNAGASHVLFGAFYGNSVIFQEIEMQELILANEVENLERYQCYIRYCQTAGLSHARFGIARLDKFGNVAEIIASKVTARSFNYQVREEWLELPERWWETSPTEELIRLAFFVEIPKNAVLALISAGFYVGNSNQIPSVSRESRGEEFSIPNSLAESKSFNCPLPMGTYKPEKHLCFAVYKPDAMMYAIQATQTDFSLSPDGKIQVLNVPENCPTDSIVCGFNVPNLKINYFSYVTPLESV